MTVGYASLSLVRAGWTGTVAVTYSGVTTTVTPRTRESIASIFARLVHEVYVGSGLSLTVKSLDDTALVVSAASAFDLTLTGTIETRSGLTAGPYTGASSYTGDPTDVGRAAFVGVRVDSPTALVPIGGTTAAGGFAYAQSQALGRTRIRWWTSASSAWGDEQSSGVYDVWLDGRVFGRYRIDGWTRSPMGRRRDTAIELVADAQAVTQ